MSDTAKVALVSAALLLLGWWLVGRAESEPGSASALSMRAQQMAWGLEIDRQHLRAAGLDEKYLVLMSINVEPEPEVDELLASMPFVRFELESYQTGYVLRHERIAFDVDRRVRYEGDGEVFMQGRRKGTAHPYVYVALCALADSLDATSKTGRFGTFHLHDLRTRLRVWHRGEAEPREILTFNLGGPPAAVALASFLRERAREIEWKETEDELWYDPGIARFPGQWESPRGR